MSREKNDIDRLLPGFYYSRTKKIFNLLNKHVNYLFSRKLV